MSDKFHKIVRGENDAYLDLVEVYASKDFIEILDGQYNSFCCDYETATNLVAALQQAIKWRSAQQQYYESSSNNREQ